PDGRDPSRTFTETKQRQVDADASVGTGRPIQDDDTLRDKAGAGVLPYRWQKRSQAAKGEDRRKGLSSGTNAHGILPQIQWRPGPGASRENDHHDGPCGRAAGLDRSLGNRQHGSQRTLRYRYRRLGAHATATGPAARD